MYSRAMHALHDLSLTVAQGEFVFLDRPSGAQVDVASSLADAGAADVWRSGSQRADPGEFAAPRGAGTSAQHRVHLSDLLIPTRTVVENVSFVPEVMGTRVPAAAPHFRC